MSDNEAIRLFSILIADEERRGPLSQRLRKMMREEAREALREHEAERQRSVSTAANGDDEATHA